MAKSKYTAGQREIGKALGVSSERARQELHSALAAFVRAFGKMFPEGIDYAPDGQAHVDLPVTLENVEAVLDYVSEYYVPLGQHRDDPEFLEIFCREWASEFKEELTYRQAKQLLSKVEAEE